MDSITRWMWLALAACGGSACSGAGAGGAAPVEATAHSADAPLHRGYLSAPVDEAAMVAALRQDAARAWQADPAGWRVSVTPQTWADGAMGCPQPGQAYTMALVPGWRIVIESGGRQRSYHASRAGAWLLCPPGAATQAPPADGPVSR